MAGSWKLTGHAAKPVIQSALLQQEEMPDWDSEVVITGFEVADDKPDDWVLEAYYPRKPNASDRQAVAALFLGETPEFACEKLPDTDWVTESQKGVEPIRAGKFFVHTPDHSASDDAGVRSLCIPASQAFGTGQHATTAGCLAMLTSMKRNGVIARNLADIGTGTGLLAFAAMELWPHAEALASDIDQVCVEVVEYNAALNGIAMGDGHGRLTMVVAPGVDDPLIQAREPYDLLIANILAGPLIELASEFSAVVPPGGNILLAGLLEVQEAAVRRAYREAGFRLAARLVNGDWSILWLRKRSAR